MDKLAAALINTGLIQFGRFEPDAAPLKLNLEMLPSSPEVLALIADRASGLVGRTDRLVCLYDSLPFGVALSLVAGIPLVYSRAASDDPTRDLVGSYDIGHPAFLVANTTQSQTTIDLSKFASGARKVGLHIDHMIAIIEYGQHTPAGVASSSLLRLPELIDDLAHEGIIPPGHARMIEEWLQGTA